MNETEWLGAADPSKMLDRMRRKASPRKLRLFAVACCRQVGRIVDSESLRLTLEHAERMADDVTGFPEPKSLFSEPPALGITSNDIRACSGTLHRPPTLQEMAEVVRGWHECPSDQWYPPAVLKRPGIKAHREYAYRAAVEVSKHVAIHPAGRACDRGIRLVHRILDRSERSAQADLLRDIMGNPFRPVTLGPAWRTPDVLAIAGAIYEERAFDRMPILGDALEEAGCADPVVLDHCRRPASHVRGCWLVDDLLGKS